MSINFSLKKASETVLSDLKKVVEQLTPDQYKSISPLLKTSSIGQHVRHILELFELMIESPQTGTINYDQRKRDLQLESSPTYAVALIENILLNMPATDRPVIVTYEVFDTDMNLHSTIFREWMYQIEHCIHHAAQIKVALSDRPDLNIPEKFGVAFSTISHQKKLKSA